MKSLLNLTAAVAVALPAAFALPATADTKLTWGLTADATSLDPQGRLGAVEFIFLRMGYEGLTSISNEQKVIPALAESWTNIDPTTWVFKLREGVQFHDGQDFTSEDVVFAIERTQGEKSGFKSFAANIASVTANGPHEVQIVTKTPDPLLLSNLASVFIMDSGWAAEHGVIDAPDAASPEPNYTDNVVNGTGPFKLTERKLDIGSTFVRNENWWGQGSFPGNITEIDTRPIGKSSTRVASLLSGELDMAIDIPLADIARVESDSNLKTAATPQLRTIFLGFNTAADTLETTGLDTNPFRDVRVRQAVNLAIDADLIQSRIMRGISQPTSTLVPPTLAGHDAELEQRSSDMEQAKALLAEAGYPEGFQVRLDCPNNRYLNDEAICQAVTSMLSKAGIKVTLNSLPRDKWGPLLTGKKTDFYLLGFGTPTNDSHFMAGHIFQRGPYHSGYQNDRVDELMAMAAEEIDQDKRNAQMREVFQIAKDEAAIAPIHYQVITWGMSNNIDLTVDPNNIPDFRYLVKN